MRIASISIQAELDIDQIWAYVAADNVTAADRYIDQIGVRSESIEICKPLQINEVPIVFASR